MQLGLALQRLRAYVLCLNGCLVELQFCAQQFFFVVFEGRQNLSFFFFLQLCSLSFSVFSGLSSTWSHDCFRHHKLSPFFFLLRFFSCFSCYCCSQKAVFVLSLVELYIYPLSALHIHKLTDDAYLSWCLRTNSKSVLSFFSPFLHSFLLIHTSHPPNYTHTHTDTPAFLACWPLRLVSLFLLSKRTPGSTRLSLHFFLCLFLGLFCLSNFTLCETLKENAYLQ